MMNDAVKDLKAMGVVVDPIGSLGRARLK